MATSTEDFKPGDWVIIDAPARFKKWNGQRGIVQVRGDYVGDQQRFVYVYVEGKDFGIGGWRPEHLRKVDNTAEAEAELGSGYFE